MQYRIHRASDDGAIGAETLLRSCELVEKSVNLLKQSPLPTPFWAGSRSGMARRSANHDSGAMLWRDPIGLLLELPSTALIGGRCVFRSFSLLRRGRLALHLTLCIL